MNNGIRESLSGCILCGSGSDILSCATAFRFSKDVEIRYCGGSHNWKVVINNVWVLNAQEGREWEPQPSDRDEEFISSTRFDFATAWKKATETSIQIETANRQKRQERHLKKARSIIKNSISRNAPVSTVHANADVTTEDTKDNR